MIWKLIPEDVQPTAWVCGRLLASTACSNPARGTGVCHQAEVSAKVWSLIQGSPTQCGVWIWLWSLALAHLQTKWAARHMFIITEEHYNKVTSLKQHPSHMVHQKWYTDALVSEHFRWCRGIYFFRNSLFVIVQVWHICLKHCFSNGPIKRNQMLQTMQMSQSRNVAVLGNYMMCQHTPSRVWLPAVGAVAPPCWK